MLTSCSSHRSYELRRAPSAHRGRHAVLGRSRQARVQDGPDQVSRQSWFRPFLCGGDKHERCPVVERVIHHFHYHREDVGMIGIGAARCLPQQSSKYCQVWPGSIGDTSCNTLVPLLLVTLPFFLRYRYHLHRTLHRDHTVVCNSTSRRVASHRVPVSLLTTGWLQRIFSITPIQSTQSCISTDVAMGRSRIHTYLTSPRRQRQRLSHSRFGSGLCFWSSCMRSCVYVPGRECAV
jgi:hypothetical protein